MLCSSYNCISHVSNYLTDGTLVNPTANDKDMVVKLFKTCSQSAMFRNTQINLGVMLDQFTNGEKLKQKVHSLDVGRN